MRDGVKLSTDVDFPPFFPAGRRAPAVFERSPYGHAAEELIALVFAEYVYTRALTPRARKTRHDPKHPNT